MSAAVDPQSLLDSASCYLCFSEQPLLKLALLRQILLAQSPMADTSPQALLNSANCYLCMGNSPALLQAMELSLLAQIVQTGGGGGGGGGGVFFVASPTDPNGTVTATRPALCYDDIGNLWEKTNATNDSAGWEKIITAEAGLSPQMQAAIDLTPMERRLNSVESLVTSLKESPAKALVEDPEESVPVKVIRPSRRNEPMTVPAPVVPGHEAMKTPIDLTPTRASFWSKVKAFLFSFFAWFCLVMAFLPAIAKGALPPPVVHSGWTTNAIPNGSKGAIVTNVVLQGQPTLPQFHQGFYNVPSGTFLGQDSSGNLVQNGTFGWDITGYFGPGPEITSLSATNIVGTLPQSVLPNPLLTNNGAPIYYIWTNSVSGAWLGIIPGLGLVKSNAVTGAVSLLGTNAGWNIGGNTPVGPGNLAVSNSVLVSAGRALTIGSGNALEVWGTNTAAPALSVNKTNGNVGIGTTNPLVALQVNGVVSLGAPIAGYYGGSTVNFQGTGADPKFIVNDTGAGNPAYYFLRSGVSKAAIDIEGAGAPSNDLRFFSNDGNWHERMRIQQSGNVGIGTTTPSSLLSVAGTAGVSIINVTNAIANLPTNQAPTSVTIGVTSPDTWVWFTNSGTAYAFPAWKNH